MANRDTWDFESDEILEYKTCTFTQLWPSEVGKGSRLRHTFSLPYGGVGLFLRSLSTGLGGMHISSSSFWYRPKFSVT